MTKAECEARAKAEEKLKAYWETVSERDISRKMIYRKLAADRDEIDKKLLAMDKSLTTLAKDAGLEIKDISKEGDIFVVVERHMKVL